MTNGGRQIKRIIKRMYKEGKVEYYEVALVLTILLLNNIITVSEFKAILMETFDNDYVLMLISLYFSEIILYEETMK